jgi:hypothetical protein
MPSGNIWGRIPRRSIMKQQHDLSVVCDICTKLTWVQIPAAPSQGRPAPFCACVTLTPSLFVMFVSPYYGLCGPQGLRIVINDLMS